MDQALIAIALLVAASAGFAVGAIVASGGNERLRQVLKGKDNIIAEREARIADLVARERERARTTPVKRSLPRRISQG